MTSSEFASQILPGLNGTNHRPAGVIVALEGTSYPGFPGPPSMILDDGTGFWSGFSSGLVGGVCNLADGLLDSYLVPYSAPTLPMWPGVQEGREKIVSFIDGYARSYQQQWDALPAIFGTGYSQGSMGWDQVWVLDVLPENGRLNYLKESFYRIYQFGHVFRSPGIAWGNALAGLSQSIMQAGVETGGIGGPLDLTPAQTNVIAPDGQPVVKSCANLGDIYACCSTGLTPWTALAPEGAIADIFYKIIMQPTFVDVISTAAVLEHPIAGIEEMFNAMKFFAEGPVAPHYQYYTQMVACINECVQVASSLPHQM